MHPHRALVVALHVFSLAVAAPFAVAAPSVYSESHDTAKPWTRWWWPGSAVDEASITHQLEQFAEAGIGGVEITPIYGARGAEARYLEFLSPRYMEMLAHVGREAKRLGLGVDMATGTGWPFGGPWVGQGDASHKLVLADGRLAGEPTRMMVKRAAPGGEGLVVDPYSVEALGRYLGRIGEAFEAFSPGLIRGQFHDSFEYYGAAWSPQLPEVFREMHGYDIQEHAAALMGQGEMERERLARLKGDYRATLAKMHLDFLREWVRWSHERGFVVRNQSHGAPANLLDLYANADVPETETFGSTPFPIPGLRRDVADVRHDQDLPESLVIRFASSAAHVAGRPLASSETCTWLRDHWKVSLAMTKPEIDRLFAAGINHVFYHGTVFSPTDAAWPGWLFYASTQFQPQNTWWQDFAALNAYVHRVQTVLQSGTPDHDVLLYWPFHDVLEDPQGTMKMFGVHHVDWALRTPFGRLAAELEKLGHGFDYISDEQVGQLAAKNGRLVAPGGTYRVLVVPETRRMPLDTLRALVALAEAGAVVQFEGMPRDVPGLGRLEERRAEFTELIARLEALASDGKARVYISRGPFAPDDNAASFRAASVRRERVAEQGLSIIRRALPDGHAYFVANLTGSRYDGWARLEVDAAGVTITDPVRGQVGMGAVRRHSGWSETFLQLAPGESLLLRTHPMRVPRLAPWVYLAPQGSKPVAIAGEWNVEFLEGGPEIPDTFRMSTHGSWTDAPDVRARAFGGTARYTIEFDAPSAVEGLDEWVLDLGDVRESARVRLNGEDLGTLWSLPMQVRVGHALKPGRNVLEVDVTNLAANRIRDLDTRGVDWKIMHEINFVNILYRPFDASQWPLQPSGLLGPVRLLARTKITPR
ncbi:glycosyl hydrolase [Opitutales bacterium ASA1]|uniref:glycosyl hydrolase n=1 Tax=Congregicoccus parvus TaxID=3081749 RepID=UPI002B2982CC|nr:glycosyl hydrolase [Opitutales bacterium ASA1]